MGPGGRGLEVTRYIGTCLISAPVPVPAGCDGAPLCRQLPPLSRLALHTQGAPLILAAGGAAAGSGGRRHAPRHHQQQQQQPQHRPQPPPRAAAAATAPAEGAASDESSGPSETSLPRIIKPRKRRKKDRKPAAAAPPPPAAPAPARKQPAAPAGASASGSSIVTLRPYVPLCFQLYGRDKSRPQPQAPQRRPEAAAAAAAAAASACQCRYCDPRGRIWDVRRHGFSPVLTAPAPAPESPFASIPLFLGAPAAAHAGDSDDGFFSEELPALRRSFSACSSSSSSYSGDASQGLQVSTEIVTSPNGHRDLEIRFYSCSPPAASAEGAAAEERGDGDGDAEGECAEKLLGESLWANIVRADADAEE